MINNKFSELGLAELHTFWEVVEELFNAMLFLLIGFEIVTFTVKPEYIAVGLLSIPIVLAARFLTVAIPMTIFKRFKRYAPYVISVLTWGGLRGGLALALALSLPKTPMRDLFLIITYCVVLFSIIVQGLTAKPLIAKTRAQLAKGPGRSIQ